MLESDICWLAGLLEGEAFFGSLLRAGGTYTWEIRVNMTDRDVLERARRILGQDATLSGPYPRPNPKHTPLYRLYIGRREVVEEWLLRLLPHMGERRSVRMREMLEEMTAHPRQRLREPACGTESAYKNRGCRCDPCRAAVTAAGQRRRLAARALHESARC